MKIEKIKKQITTILRKYGAKRVSLFGSVARNEDEKTSDIDILVDFEDEKTLMDLVRIQLILEKKIGRKVDLLTYEAIHPLLRDDVLKDEKVIYGKRT